MRRLAALLVLAPAFIYLLMPPWTAGAAPKGESSELTPVMVQDFEKASSPPDGVGRQHPQRECLGRSYRPITRTTGSSA